MGVPQSNFHIMGRSYVSINEKVIQKRACNNGNEINEFIYFQFIYQFIVYSYSYLIDNDKQTNELKLEQTKYRKCQISKFTRYERPLKSTQTILHTSLEHCPSPSRTSSYTHIHIPFLDHNFFKIFNNLQIKIPLFPDFSHDRCRERCSKTSLMGIFLGTSPLLLFDLLIADC